MSLRKVRQKSADGNYLHSTIIEPSRLRAPLIKEYQDIIQNFLEQRRRPSELSGGAIVDTCSGIATHMRELDLEREQRTIKRNSKNSHRRTMDRQHFEDSRLDRYLYR